MRVAPRALISVGLAVVYLTIMVVTWLVVGFDYDAVGSSTTTVVEGIVIPVALASIFLAAATSYLGWWGPALHESMRAPRWLWVVPVLMLMPGVGFLIGGAGAADRAGSFLLALGVGCLLVGFGEELLTRGTGLVGLRGQFGEALSWFFSCLIFGLLHAANALFGQSIGSTVQQVMIALLAGSVLYVTRRVSGTLIVSMLLHAWVDFTTFAFSDAAIDAESPFVAFATLQWLGFLLALIGVVVMLRRDRRRAGTPTQTLSAA